MEEKAMYSRTILLTAASLAVAGAANATPVNLCQPAVARSINPSRRVGDRSQGWSLDG
jgi:hypothetical protein